MANLRVHPDRMRDNLDATDGLIISERAGIELGSRLGRAEARAALDRASKQAVTEGIPLAQALGEDQVDTDPTTYLGSAAALVDAALQRKAAG